MAVDQAQMQNFSSMFLPAVESVNPCLILIVRRENIVGDTMEVLRKSKNVDYKKPLKVKAATISTVDEWGFHLVLSTKLQPFDTDMCEVFQNRSCLEKIIHSYQFWGR